MSKRIQTLEAENQDLRSEALLNLANRITKMADQLSCQVVTRESPKIPKESNRRLENIFQKEKKRIYSRLRKLQKKHLTLDKQSKTQEATITQLLEDSASNQEQQQYVQDYWKHRESESPRSISTGYQQT